VRRSSPSGYLHTVGVWNRAPVTRLESSTGRAPGTGRNTEQSCPQPVDKSPLGGPGCGCRSGACRRRTCVWVRLFAVGEPRCRLVVLLEPWRCSGLVLAATLWGRVAPIPADRPAAPSAPVLRRSRAVWCPIPADPGRSDPAVAQLRPRADWTASADCASVPCGSPPRWPD
jgi:hypothetical protein